MLSLLIATISTSAVDSLNPVAITQQFVLQGLVKKRYHIWYYIMATAIVNFSGGMIVYYGLGAFLKNYMDQFLASYSKIIYAAELILGIAMLIAVCYIIMNKKIKSLEEKIVCIKGEPVQQPEANTVIKFTSLNPFTLFLIGSVATICELPTALPYFTFLAIILNYKLPVITVVLIMVLYNIIYSSPLILLYILYVKRQSKVDKIYEYMKEKMTQFSHILVPLAVGGIGIYLVYDVAARLFI